MAKKKSLSLIMSLVAIALAILTITTFFMPTIKRNDSENGKFSAMEICFVSKDKCEEKLKDAVKNLDKDGTAHYTYLSAIKSNEDTAKAIQTASWFHFTAMLFAIATIVLVVLSLFGKKLGLWAKLASILVVLCMLASLISVCGFLNVEILNTPVKESYKIGVASILGFISSILTTASLFINIKSKK